MAQTAIRPAGTLTRWDPFRDLDRWFDQFAGRPEQPSQAWAPRADVSETEQEYVLDVELPGVVREDIAVEVTGNLVAVTGELKEKEREGRFHRRARRTGQFSYRVTLPRDVDGDKVEAVLDEGVLTVRVPKVDAAKPRRIEITGK
ncbi:Hsp20/alpha crystallin family protein [Amycolatopsis acidicola]|uniref:Hsp20/alpha crystallin family protein n=1 Tax=Amycolatopsis acidicola TaxID=2596893 RepID=A0A5N0UQY5_9PSEU|nr:Hsp20/alpha crystallin family protein [Amycolatopsis acidicola]KAA9149830.1 Hsp20/alpha crystallin family protein [Amycolatopsis acidicola]